MAATAERPTTRQQWIMAAIAVGLILGIWGCTQLVNRPAPPHPHADAIAQALRGHGATVESITGGRTAVIQTDLDSRDDLDAGAAEGICRILEARNWPDDLKLAEVRSASGNEMATCVLADYD